jgi:GNAT superfamily N-acetyltransferase
MEAPRYTIRDTVTADVEALTRMHAQSWLDTYPNEGAGVSRAWVEARTATWLSEENLEKKRARVQEALVSDDLMYKVAENEAGKIVGMISPFRNETIQRVGAIYVDKAYHGTGLAQALMDQVIAWADPHRPLELTVTTYNDRAKAFYRKYGFVEQQDSEHIVHDILPVITMIRKGDQQ